MIRLYLEGASFRAIGRLLNINHQTVSNWISDSSAQLPSKVTDAQSAESIAIDELFSFIGAKKKKFTS